MKVLFLQNTGLEHFGIMYLSAILKKQGHDCDVYLDSIEKKLKGKIRNYKPDLIAFSTATSEIGWVLEKAREIKKAGFKQLIIMGGPHPTFYPEIIEDPNIDIICIGEGEEAIVELADKIEKGKSIKKIRNLYVKEGGKIYKNPVRPLIENLDELPFPDRTIYDKYDFLREISIKRFLASRGCPYNCSFCFNHMLKKIYKGKGKYVRFRSPGNLLQEIKELRKKYNFKTISFTDDTFILDKEWLFEFLDRYKKEVNLPFACDIRANLITDEVARKLREANCRTCSMGVESGSERIRNKILKKGLSNEQIMNAARAVKKYGIFLKTYNITGFPEETLEELYETAEFNRKIKSDMPSGSFLLPFPKLEITDHYIRRGDLPSNFDFNMFQQNAGSHSLLRLKHKNQAENLPAFFYVWAKYPILRPLIKQIIKLPPTKAMKTLTNIIYALRSLKLYNLKFGEVLSYAIKSRFRLQ